MTLNRRLFLALIACASAGHMHAAEIAQSTNPQCAIDFAGPVQSGDADKLLALLESNHMVRPGREGNDYRTKALCLNSKGGDFLEGQKIARIVYESGVPTRLLPDSSCFSSCAFIFMAGRSLGEEWDGPYRGMSKTAWLGFHAPYTSFDDGEALTGVEVNSLVKSYNSIIGEFIEFGQSKSIFNYRSNFSQDLLSKLLRMRPDELLMVETIQDAERWKIELEDVRVPAVFDAEAVANACKNFQAWSIDLQSESTDSFQPDVTKVELTSAGKKKSYFKIDTGGMAERYCLIRPSNDLSGYEICSVDGFNGLSFGNCPDYGIYVAGFYGQRADALIALLP